MAYLYGPVLNGCGNVVLLFGNPILYAHSTWRMVYPDTKHMFSLEFVNEKVQKGGGFRRGWYRFENYWVVQEEGFDFKTFKVKAQIGTQWPSGSRKVLEWEESFLKQLAVTQTL